MDNEHNTSEVSPDYDHGGFSSSLLTFAAVMTFIIMVVGIVGNFLTIAALIKCPKVRNVAAAFIISLCLADLLFCALVLPFSAFRFIQGTWTHGEVLCKLIPFIQYGNIGVSLLCIAMITINRYVMIAHHTLYGSIYKTHWIAAMLAFCWIFSYGMQLPTLIGVWGIFGYDPKLGTCSIMNDKNGGSSKTFLFIIAFIIPCLIIIACYSKIFWVVHKSETRLKRHTKKQNSIPNNLRPVQVATTDNSQNSVSVNAASDTSASSEVKHEISQKPSRIKDQREVRARRNEWRITKMVLGIFLSFLVCYLPITIAKVTDKDVDYPTFHIISYIMLYLSSCINPIIYVIMNKQYRKAYKTVILCEPSKLMLFGKSVRNSNGEEKWKDAALSSNHGQTILSQMSTLDQQNTSLSNSQIPQITLELTTKASANDQMENLKDAAKSSTGELNNQKTQATPMLPCPTEKISQQNLLSKDQTRAPTLQNAEVNQTTLNGGDIILEEEMDLPAMEQEKPPLDPKKIFYANMGAPKKIPYYGPNINVTLDDAKVTKLKI